MSNEQWVSLLAAIIIGAMVTAFVVSLFTPSHRRSEVRKPWKHRTVWIIGVIMLFMGGGWTLIGIVLIVVGFKLRRDAKERERNEGVRPSLQ